MPTGCQLQEPRHADTVPLRHATKNGERHLLLLVDDYSRAMFVRLLSWCQNAWSS